MKSRLARRAAGATFTMARARLCCAIGTQKTRKLTHCSLLFQPFRLRGFPRAAPGPYRDIPTNFQTTALTRHKKARCLLFWDFTGIRNSTKIRLPTLARTFSFSIPLILEHVITSKRPNTDAATRNATTHTPWVRAARIKPQKY